jgi:hypothetical protein
MISFDLSPKDMAEAEKDKRFAVVGDLNECAPVDLIMNVEMALFDQLMLREAVVAIVWPLHFIAGAAAALVGAAGPGGPGACLGGGCVHNSPP